MGSLWYRDIAFREEALAIYIKRTFGAEGLRHLLGLLIGLDENFRQGYFEWNLNEHLERMGYRKKNGAYDIEVKQTALEILKIFTGILITVEIKKGNRERISGRRLFNIDGFDIEKADNEIIKEGIILRATDFWYKNAFCPADGKSPQFTKMLRKIAQENHRNHPYTIYLAPLLAVYWRISTEFKLSIQRLLEWCDVDTNDRRWKTNLRQLEAELNYMREHGYLGNWSCSSGSIPSESDNPLRCVLTMTPPDWLAIELRQILAGKERHLAAATAPRKNKLTREQFVRVFELSELSVSEFGSNLGLSRQMVNYILKGDRKVSVNVSAKVYAVFGNLLST